MKCKYILRNQIEKKCSDDYESHGTHKHGTYCRLKEWKQKKGVCPYDKSIFSIPKKIKKDYKSKIQKTLT